jgi:hypothetical protein
VWGKLALAALGLMLAFLLSEGILRLAGVAPDVVYLSVGRYRSSPDPRIGYEPIPNFSHEGSQLRYFEFFGTSNSLGFRDDEPVVPKPADENRILVLGDSITMGLLLPQTANLYTSILQRLLRRRDPGARVLNFGVAGYNTMQEVAILETKGLALEPDVVILQYCMNDREMVNGGIVEHLRALERRRGGIDPSPLPRGLKESALYRFLRYRVFPDRVQRKRASDRARALEHLGDDTVEESFARLGELARREGFEVLTVLFPRLTGFQPGDDEEYRIIAGYSAANGFHHLDLRDTFAACREGGEIALDDLHPNQRGHGCAAIAIAGAMRAADLDEVPSW